MASALSDRSPPPFSMVRVAQRWASGRTASTMKAGNAAVCRIIIAVAMGSASERTMLVTRASRIHPTASSIAAAEMVMAPMRVRLRPYSIMMRPRMGSAVMHMAVAMNR